MAEEASRIKIEHVLLIMEKDSGFMKISNSLYLLVPSDIVKKLRREAGLDLKKERNQITPQCKLLSDKGEPILQFRFSKIRRMPHQ